MNMVVVLFNKPIMAIDFMDNGDKMVVELYGYRINESDEPYDKKQEENYIKYLCGATKWFWMGNQVSPNKNLWVDSETSTAFCDSDSRAKRFCNKAYKEMRINHTAFRYDDEQVPEDAFEDSFLTSRDAWKTLQSSGTPLEEEQENKN